MDTLRADVKARLKGGEPEMTQEQFDAAFTAHEGEISARMVSDWAKEAWKKAKDAGVFDGTAPGAPLTREQAALILERLGLLGK